MYIIPESEQLTDNYSETSHAIPLTPNKAVFLFPAMAITAIVSAKESNY